jgi:hypothetical protein
MRARNLIFLMLILAGCIDEVNLRMERAEPKLVIEAWLSNDPSMTYAKIYYSAPFVSADFHIPLEDAPISGVWVETEGGSSFDFRPSWATGNSAVTLYTPNRGFTFEPGNRYRLIVILGNGDRIESDWQEVYEKAQSIEFEHEMVTRTVFVNRWNGPPFPQERQFYDFSARIEKASAMSGHNYYVKASGIEQLFTVPLGEFCNCICYLPYPNMNNALTAVYSDSPISTILAPMGSMAAGYVTKFYIKADVYSVSATAAAFLNSIGEQQTNTGSIFDPMPYKIKGNLKNLDNPGQEILGNFFTANHTSQDKMVDRAELSRNRIDRDIRRVYPASVFASCKEEYPEATTTPPPPFQRP